MHRLALGAVLLILVAGCSGPATTTTSSSGPSTAQSTTLHFRAPHDFGTKIAPVVAAGTSCTDSVQDRDCGLGEPEIEVDSRNTVYISGTCCVTSAPPIYVSRDAGGNWSSLTTPTGVREAEGIEGDFAIDATGKVYFSDIEFAATFQVTVWDKDGTYVRHTKWPAPPLVDRDWVRAEGDGTVYYAYNTGSATNVYKSTDSAMTFSPVYLHQAGFGLGMAVLGPKAGQYWLLGPGTSDHTDDGGTTWKVEPTTAPPGNNFVVGAFDEAGNLYVGSDRGNQITIAERTAEGKWLPPVNVTAPARGKMPWLAAGRDGAVAVAWYGTNASSPDHWQLNAAVSRDHGQSWESAIGDSDPVFVGDLQRDLLDFFQVEIGPDGALHIAYSSLATSEGNEEHLRYVRSEPDPTLAAVDYKNGP